MRFDRILTGLLHQKPNRKICISEHFQNSMDNKQIFYTFLFNIINYSSEVNNIQQREAELNTLLWRVNNFNIKQRYGIFVLLYANRASRIRVFLT